MLPVRLSSQRLPDSHPRSRERNNNRNRDRDRERSARRGATATRNPAGSRQLPPWLWLVAGIGGGMLITSLLHLWTSSEPTEVVDEPAQQVQQVQQKPVVVKKPRAPEPAVERRVEAPVEAVAVEEAEPVTQFDFYTLLPEREVIVPEREVPAPAKPVVANPAAAATQPTATAATPVASGSESYLLQAGSFRGNADAERRRAQVAALGLQVRVEKVGIGADILYRVNAGPFTSRDQLATARSRLSAQGIETLQIRQK